MNRNLSALQKDYQDTLVTMRGISPKLAIYAELNEKLEEIKKRLGDNNLPKVSHLLASKTGRRIKTVDTPRGTDHLKPKLTICCVPGCTSKRASCSSKCGTHLHEKRLQKRQKITRCNIADCEQNRMRGKRFCEKHYQEKVDLYNVRINKK